MTLSPKLSAARRLAPRDRLVLSACWLGAPARAAEKPRLIPPPAVDEPAAERPGSRGRSPAAASGACKASSSTSRASSSAVSGYDGGDKATAHYEMTSRGDTGHAESVRITFDPSEISYGRILQIYFSVAHDPTELNRQGPDEGTQYRSAIFPANDEQARVAKAYIAQLDQAHVFDAAIVTKIEPGRTFYPAEDYHQDFLAPNPTYPYIVFNDLPKIETLKRLFPDVYRADPVLVRAGHS